MCSIETDDYFSIRQLRVKIIKKKNKNIKKENDKI